MRRNLWRFPAAVASVVVLASMGAVPAAFAVPSVPAPSSSASPSTGSGTSSGSTGTVGRSNATFGIGPARDGKLDSRSIYQYVASPGGTVVDHVLVSNLQTKPVTLDVYPVNVTSSQSGQLDYHAKTAPRRDLASWVSISTPNSSGSVTLPARSTKVLALELKVPRTAEPGDHIAAVMASITGVISDPNKQQLGLEQRVGVQMDLRVTGAVRPALTIENLQTTFHGPLNPVGTGTTDVSWVVHNTGNTDIGAHQALRLTGFLGSTGQVPVLADVPVLVPGSAYPVTVRVPGVWPEFSVSARVVLSAVAVQVDASHPAMASTSAAMSFLAIPWAFLIMVVVVLLLVALGVYLERRRRRNAKAPRHGHGGRGVLVGAR